MAAQNSINTESAPVPEPGHVDSPARRRFIAWLLGIGGAIVAILLCIPLVRTALYPLFAKTGQSEWSDLGTATQFGSLATPIRQLIKIQTLDGWQESISEKVVYITKGAGGNLLVLTAVCPHLGCEVQWRAQSDKFVCPCHNSIFAPDGRYISGPAPRGMDALPTSIQNGHLMTRYEYFRNLVPNKEVIG